MYKIISIILTFLILSQTSEVSFVDVLKVKNLYEHVKFHQEQYGDSLLDFLTEHYGGSDMDQKNDHQDHDNLPFKHSSKTCSHHILLFTIDLIHQELKIDPSLDSRVNFFYKETTSVFELDSILQPPQFT
ncbi:MAG: hypothetical protein KJO83_06465 [Bacteroidia bacterium]|nr:hypothetical protein [Bacteroidia bacterium]